MEDLRSDLVRTRSFPCFEGSERQSHLLPRKDVVYLIAVSKGTRRGGGEFTLGSFGVGEKGIQKGFEYLFLVMGRGTVYPFQMPYCSPPFLNKAFVNFVIDSGLKASSVKFLQHALLALRIEDTRSFLALLYSSRRDESQGLSIDFF